MTGQDEDEGRVFDAGDGVGEAREPDDGGFDADAPPPGDGEPRSEEGMRWEAARKNAGMTVRWAAACAGVTAHALMRVEASTTPGPVVGERLAVLYGTTTATIRDGVAA